MNILLFIDNLGAGGAQRQMVGLAVMLQQKGYSVKVCTYQNIDFFKYYLDDNNVPNEVIPNAEDKRNRIGAVRKYFKAEAPDCVISYLETPSLVASIVKLLGCNYKLIVSERNTTQHVGNSERVRFFMYHWADRIVPNSYSQEKWLSSHHPWMRKKITVISNFVDLEHFAFTEHNRREIPVIMTAASIWSSKNTPGLIEVAKILKDKGVKCRFRWFGRTNKWISFFNECKSKVDEYGLQEMFELLPKTKDIYKEYQDADYFCLPSFYEGVPNVICEAISTGLPIMCSNVCDNPHYVVEGKNGVMFNPNDSIDMANKIALLLSQTDDEYQANRKESRSIAERLLDEDVFLNKYIKIIN